MSAQGAGARCTHAHAATAAAAAASCAGRGQRAGGAARRSEARSSGASGREPSMASTCGGVGRTRKGRRRCATVHWSELQVLQCRCRTVLPISARCRPREPLRRTIDRCECARGRSIQQGTHLVATQSASRPICASASSRSAARPRSAWLNRCAAAHAGTAHSGHPARRLRSLTPLPPPPPPARACAAPATRARSAPAQLPARRRR